MAKQKLLLTFDTETCTIVLPDSWNLTANEKKKISIARPLIYDIGWTISSRSAGIIEKKNYLIAETFSVPSVFNTAYYKEKYPIYIDMINNGELSVKPWREVMEIFLADCEQADLICAFDEQFDLRAINFTELYINKLYSPNYQSWYENQVALCWKIAHQPYKKENDKGFDPLHFTFRNKQYKVMDIWGLACENIINTPTYKRACLEHSLISPSGMYFSTNAENVRRFIYKEYGFIEEHTALSDAEIETEILLKALKRGKKVEGIALFPFRKLGYVSDFIAEDNRITPTMAQNALDILNAYIDQHSEQPTPYLSQVINHSARIEKKRDSLLWDE